MNIEKLVYSFCLLVILFLMVGSIAHAQVSTEVVPPGCYTSFETGDCYEPVNNFLWQYFEDNPDFAFTYYGPVVGSLFKSYFDDYQKLLMWRELAKKRARRILILERRLRKK